MSFRYHAINSAGQAEVDTISAASPREAADLLRERGLFVTQIDAVADGDVDSGGTSTGGTKAGGRLGDVIFFTQQMSMLIRSGAQVVQALEAIEEQTQRPAWREVIRTVRLEVEEGRPLSEALGHFPRLFTGVYTSMIAAGEASGDMGLAFDRLATLTRQQQEVRSRVIGALAYPVVLLFLCVGVLIALFSFVLPRFAEMFETLDVELPVTTAMMISSSKWTQDHWPYVFGAAVAGGVGAFAFLGSQGGRRFISRFSVRVPIFGRIVRSVLFARICRIWGQLLDSKVGLLEAVQLTRDSTTSLDFQELMTDLEQAITEGNSIGPPLKGSWLLPKTFAAAIVTGEGTGKLSYALLFAASCLEDENAQVLASLARVIEPIILTVMGAVVGTVAISLFLPMFDMATLAGG